MFYKSNTLLIYKILSKPDLILFCVTAALLLAPAVIADRYTGKISELNQTKPGAYSSSESCSNCHLYLFKQYEKSMHARAFSNPVFQNQVYNVLLPQLIGDADAMQIAGSCLACHSPTTFLTQDKSLPSRNMPGNRPSGVTCDFCHTITGHSGSVPGNANYTPSPGPTKYGPFKYASDWHRQYSAFHRNSEICAVCHEATNANGVQIHTTYSEWKTSSWPKKGIECQDCHMSASGRLIEGRPIFESGIIASAKYLSPQVREKVFSHRFPGANVNKQIEGAVKLMVYSFPTTVRPGSTIFIGVSLDNSEAGHSLPTGAIELRLAWLDVRLKMQEMGLEWQLKAEPVNNNSWDVAGMNPADVKLSDSEITEGSRIYRAILVDAKGQPTLNNWEAVNKVFDNRLEAGEVRREMFRFTLPVNAKGNLEIEVKLRYLRYPPGFAPADSVMMAQVRKKIEMKK